MGLIVIVINSKEKEIMTMRRLHNFLYITLFNIKGCTNRGCQVWYQYTLIPLKSKKNVTHPSVQCTYLLSSSKSVYKVKGSFMERELKVP